MLGAVMVINQRWATDTASIYHNAGPKRRLVPVSSARPLGTSLSPGQATSETRAAWRKIARAHMALSPLFSFLSLLLRSRLCMIHGNPSNSTPIFLSARATPDGKLAYGLLYQVPPPPMVTLSPIQTPGPRVVARTWPVCAPQHLALFESCNAWEPTLARFAPPRTSISSVGLGWNSLTDRCPRIGTFATSVALTSIEHGPVLHRVSNHVRNYIGDNATKRGTAPLADADLRTVGPASTPANQSCPRALFPAF